MLDWQLVILSGGVLFFSSLVLVFHQRHQIRDLNWPKTTSPLRFVELCRSYLIFTGWEVKDLPDHPGDLSARKNDVDVCFICRASGSIVGPAFLANTVSTEFGQRRPILVVMGDKPDQILRAKAADIGAGLLHYPELRDLDSVVPRRIERWAAKPPELSQPEAPEDPCVAGTSQSAEFSSVASSVVGDLSMSMWIFKRNTWRGTGDQTPTGQVALPGQDARSSVDLTDPPLNRNMPASVDVLADSSDLQRDDASSHVAHPQSRENLHPVPPGSDRNPIGGDQVEFNDEWYLEQNADVAAAVAEGRGTALEHYLLYGRIEGRLPLPPDDWVKNADRSPGVPQSADPGLRDLFPRHNGASFLNPTDLSATTIAPKRVAFIGSCLLGALGLHQKNPSGCDVDLLVVNNADRLPERLSPGVDVSSYDFVVIQVPLRAIFHDTMLSALDYGAPQQAYEDAFKAACQRLRLHLECRMEWNVKHGLLTFVSNFFVPIRNIMGSLFPRFDLRNPEYFISRLNEELEAAVREYNNAYVLDVDRISASIGRSYLQEDSIALTAHGALIGPSPWITDRIEPMAPMESHYDIRAHEIFPNAMWAELISMFRIVRQVDAVKLVVVDLDDTLWTGVSGDIADVGPHMLEGWPLGIAEALSYLKKRGILLAIISKNEEKRIHEIWLKIFGNRLSLDDFAAVFVNWRPKIENMHDLLQVVNLLPRNVLFIDDNPAERDAMQRVFPDMRVLGRHPYYLRRILLWSSETQVPTLTKESSRRTEMIQAQVLREGERKQFAREDFLREAAPQVTMTRIDSMDHPRFPRAFELLNKTNQYNTTGRRWTTEEFRKLLQSDTAIHTFEVADKYTDYGLVGVIIVCDNRIEQWVMSCRVLGYEIEDAVMATIVRSLRAEGIGAIVGRLVETDANFPCRNLFSKCGFTEHDQEEWLLLGGRETAVPGHVTVRDLKADNCCDAPPPI